MFVRREEFALQSRAAPVLPDSLIGVGTSSGAGVASIIGPEDYIVGQRIGPASRSAATLLLRDAGPPGIRTHTPSPLVRPQQPS